MRREYLLILGFILILSCAIVACSPAAGAPTPTQPSQTNPPPVPTRTQLPDTPVASTPTPTEAAPSEPEVSFELTFGGSGLDRGVFVTETDDGGYILTGVTSSFGEGGEDVYLVRTGPDGEEIWAQTYGGLGLDNGWSVQQTPDGGFIIAGFTSSFGAGGIDVLLIRTDAAGEQLWSQTYGGEGDDYGWALQPAAEGGYIIAGQTNSAGAGDIDAYLIRVDEEGHALWTQTYGGSAADRTFTVQQTSDGGFIIAGTTESLGAGGRDAYVVKTDANGTLEWEKSFGDVGDDVTHSIDHTQDGGYLLMGYTNSFGARNYDIYLIKLTASGDTEWTQMFGERSEDRIITGEQTADGGYILVGYSRSYGSGSLDAYLVRTDAAGNPLWTKTFGSTGEDTGYTVQQTVDGGYILTGYTQNAANARDVYLIKVKGD